LISWGSRKNGLEDHVAPRDLVKFLERIRNPEILRAYERVA